MRSSKQKLATQKGVGQGLAPQIDNLLLTTQTIFFCLAWFLLGQFLGSARCGPSSSEEERLVGLIFCGASLLTKERTRNEQSWESKGRPY